MNRRWDRLVLLLLAGALLGNCGKEQPERNTKAPTASSPEKPSPMVFTVKEISTAEKLVVASLVAGPWTGTTIWNKQWVRVSFEVYPSEGTVTDIKVEGGLEGKDKVVWTWKPEPATASISPECSFELTDKYGNAVKGTFGAASYAHGSVSRPAFQIQCADGQFRPGPTEWRAAPEKPSVPPAAPLPR